MVKHRCSLDGFHCHLKPGFLSWYLEGFLQIFNVGVTRS
jgi:hypothetical protein